MSLILNSSNFLSNLANIEQKVLQGTRLYAEIAGAKLEAYAKTNAPWDDISGISRQTISHEVQSSGANQKIILRGGTTGHFVFLELAHEKRYAIISPTLNKLGPSIVEGWKRVVSGL